MWLIWNGRMIVLLVLVRITAHFPRMEVAVFTHLFIGMIRRGGPCHGKGERQTKEEHKHRDALPRLACGCHRFSVLKF